MRLQVFLSHNAGVSRRKAFDLVKAGAVKVNGRVVTEPGLPVEPEKDAVALEGKRVFFRSFDYLLLNKPKGYTTTRTDRYAVKTVFDLIPRPFHHLVPAGRLDRDTEGLLLFTNDGDVTLALTHPRGLVDKIYFFRVVGAVDEKARRSLERGIVIDGRRTAPAKVKNLKVRRQISEGYITVHEGRKRQIRLMFGKLGLRVDYLQRVAQGPLALGTLKPGAWRLLNKIEKEQLSALTGGQRTRGASSEDGEAPAGPAAGRTRKTRG
jgi:pseudouridine synthase